MSLDHEITAVLLQLELTSQGTTPSYNRAGGHSDDIPDPRSGDSHPPHLEYRERYDRATTDAKRREVISAAEEELRTIRHSQAKPPSETPSQREGRIIREGEGWHSREVANAHRMLEREVWAIRRRHLRDKDYGRVVEVQDLTAAERRQRVRELKAAGMTTRSIAFRLRVSHETIRGDIGRDEEAA